MAAMPESAIGRQLLSIEDQPADCGPHCLCNSTSFLTPSVDGYSARWTPDTTQENTP